MIPATNQVPIPSIFVSYTQADKAWAEWIAWTLEAAGYRVKIQAWDFRPGSNFVVEMDQAARESDRTLVVLSSHFLQSGFTQPEWAAAFARDPQGREKRLVPVRIDNCKPGGMLGQIIWIDLVGQTEEAARAALLQGFQERGKPAVPPAFPAGRPASAAPFPGAPTPEPTSSLDNPPTPVFVEEASEKPKPDVSDAAETSRRRLLGNVGLLFLIILGLACLLAAHVSFWGGVVSAILGSGLLGIFLTFVKWVTRPDQENLQRQVRKALQDRRVTYLLVTTVFLLAVFNIIFLPDPTQAAVDEALFGKPMALAIVPGNRVFHKLRATEFDDSQGYTLLVKRGRKTIVEQKVHGAGVIYTGASEEKLRKLINNSKSGLTERLQGYLRGSRGNPQEVLDIWLTSGKPIASPTLRRGNHLVVELHCRGVGKVMVQKEVDLEEDLQPVFLELEGRNPCASIP